MKLIKTTGIIIKEVKYADNDKIVTIITKDLGKISCMVKGARKQNSPHLAASQFLVYSEFVFYQGKNFYHMNSSCVIDTFYSLRVDYDKLQEIFELTKILYAVTDENQNLEKILRLFLNTLAFMKEDKKDMKFLTSIFKIKLAAYLGYKPYLSKCVNCYKQIEENEHYKYSIDRKGIVCETCKDKLDGRFIHISNRLKKIIEYVSSSKLEKSFSFSTDDETLKDMAMFSNIYIEQIKAGI